MHLYPVPVGRRIELPEFPPGNLHFDLDRAHGVAAATLLAWDRWNNVRQWMSSGDAGRDGVLLTQDAADLNVKTFPIGAFISISQPRELVVQWSFADLLPPRAVRWRSASEREAGWF